MGARGPCAPATTRRFGGTVLCLLLLGGTILPPTGLLVHEHADDRRGHLHLAPDAATHDHHDQGPLGHRHRRAHHDAARLAAHHHDETAGRAVSARAVAHTTGVGIATARHGAHVHAYDRYQRSLQAEVLRAEVWRTATQVEIAYAAAPRPARSIFSRARAPPSALVRI